VSELLRGCRRAACHLGATLPTVELPGGPGSEQACAAARQQLLTLQAGLQQGLDAAVLDSTAAGSSSSSGSGSDTAGASEGSTAVDMAAVPGLAQQLVVLGGALCAQLPLPYCCNNPGCVELRGASELQLVGGKGTVCSRCRWVQAARQLQLHRVNVLTAKYHMLASVMLLLMVCCCDCHTVCLTAW
jgi:hypothetical protein